MHSCLRSHDILLSIFRFIYQYDFHEDNRRAHDGPKPNNQPTLAALASSCQEFHETAITVLWETQTSLAPLIQVMPPDLWKRIPDRAESDSYSDDADDWDSDASWDEDDYRPFVIIFRRTVLASDWERYDHYAPKIRHLDFEFATGIQADVLIRLSTYRPNRHLIPRLQSMRLYAIQDNAIFEYLPTLLCESLRKLSILTYISDSQEESVKNLLLSTARCCPNLVELKLPQGVPNRLTSRLPSISLHHYLPGLLTLESLSIYICDITPEIIGSLRSIKKLRSLSLEAQYPLRTAVPSFMWEYRKFEEDPFFPDGDLPLHYLEILEAHPMDIRIILSSAPSSLKRLRATHLGWGHTDIFDLSSIPWENFRDLTFLHLDCAGDFSPTPADQDSPTLFCLLQLQYLHDVSLTNMPAAVLTNEWLEKLSTAWPKLKTLRLTPLHRRVEKLQMSLEGLIPISRNCACLVDLHITLLCQPFGLGPIGKSTGNRVSILQHLEFFECPLQQPSRVLRCISYLFPLLTYVEGTFERREHAYLERTSQGSSEEKGKEVWREFNKQLREAFS